jgi:hypothetical protein
MVFQVVVPGEHGNVGNYLPTKLHGVASHKVVVKADLLPNRCYVPAKLYSLASAKEVFSRTKRPTKIREQCRGEVRDEVFLMCTVGEALVKVQARVLEPPFLDCGGTDKTHVNPSIGKLEPKTFVSSNLAFIL